MKIEIYPPLCIYELGQRDNQEDYLWPDSPKEISKNLFILCDGMGGHEHGEVASRLVCISIPHFLRKACLLGNDTLTDEDLKKSLEYAYQQLDLKGDHGLKKMGTTLTLLHLGHNGVTALHMGDSRIYHIRPSVGVLYQSRDHSLAFDLYQAGEITFEEMATFPRKNIITRAMQPGEENRMRPDIVHITDVQPGDYFYMCSDGMLEQMTNEELVALLSSDMSDEEKRSQLIKATSNNKDNHSAWLIHIKDVIKEDGDDKLVNEESTTRCNAINIIPKVATTTKKDDVVVVQKEEKAKSFLQRMKEVFKNNKKQKI